MNAPPLVSVVICTRDRLALLRRSVASVLSQDYARRELIVVDDASSDGTSRWLSGHRALRHRRLADNLGPSAARNAGLALARGGLVAFLDDDDLWHDGFLSSLVPMFQTRGVQVVSSNFDLIDVDDKPRRSRALLRGRRLDPIVRALGLDYLPHISSSILRRVVFGRVGLFDEAFRAAACEDADFWYRALLAYGPAAFSLVDRSLAGYRNARTTDSARLPRMLRDWDRLGARKQEKIFDFARLLRKHEGWLSLAMPEEA